MSRAWICADRLGLVEDSFDGVIEKVLVFRSNTDKWLLPSLSGGKLSSVAVGLLWKWIVKVEGVDNWE